MRLLDRKLIIGVRPWYEQWPWGVLEGQVARWLDLGPFYIGWRH